MTENSQLLTTIPETKTKANRQTNRTGTEPQKWSSHRGLSTGECEGERGRKGIENKQHKLQVENIQGEGKNSVGNVEAKEFICMTHGHELQRGMWEGGGVQDEVE